MCAVFSVFLRVVLSQARVLGVVGAVALLAVGAAAPWWWQRLRPDRGDEALERVGPALDARLRAAGSSLGAPAFIRVFKQPPSLELWVQASDAFVLFQRYPICRFSGGLGPKTTAGDLQAPEGLYSVGLDQLNPRSRFHLSLNLGYPNAFEAARGWTGDALMIHGDCVSIGCYAMGDAAISEIYTVVREALRNGQSAVSVQALPFRLDEENLGKHARSPFEAHWRALADAYQAFESTRVPPRVEVTPRAYVVTPRR
jgi:murein L,D-transpeptidase YafK